MLLGWQTYERFFFWGTPQWWFSCWLPFKTNPKTGHPRFPKTCRTNPVHFGGLEEVTNGIQLATCTKESCVAPQNPATAALS